MCEENHRPSFSRTRGLHFQSVWLSIFTVLTLMLGFSGISSVDGGIFTALSEIITSGHSAYKEFCQREAPQEAFMSTPELITHHGYPVEEHKVVTEDGFVITVFRIPYGKSERFGAPKKEPVIIYHGFLQSSDDWLLLPNHEDCLPYLLANEGHEVWLSNFRGNTYSMDPTLSGITPDDAKYYDFIPDDLALFDIPAVVEHAKTVSKSQRVHYVGFSLGGGMIAYSLSAFSHSSFSRSISKISLLAPGLYSEHLKSPAFNLLGGLQTPASIEFARLFTGGRIISPSINAFLQKNAPQVCTGDLGIELCDNIIYFISGYNRDQMTDKTASLVSGHTPSPTAAKLLVQGQQQLALKPQRLQMFDYGPKENLKRYGTIGPPAYNLSEVRVPTQVFYATNDLLVSKPDTLRAIEELGNVVQANEVAHPNWTHLDFNYGKDAKFFVYDKVVAFLNT